ncbi:MULTISPECIES: hypothetical protein [unclassified Streptomyces]|uniref:hypothetical protein n=1 Tax=unclassified Streptomyces TaxID=2593676 RepID=UPI0023650BC2|nr:MULTISPECIES: hypothetical protein [unclassified Streptomyces]MDF3150022.1 hypothetical protein [Streptomyces sp. T21Q-yed]WDF41632.1 hypothetical protein PBV52_34985 [Streptomyces sp. T12]
MTLLHLFSVLLALSVSVHVGCSAAFIAWRGGSRPTVAVLIGGGAIGLYFAAVAAYR